MPAPTRRSTFGIGFNGFTFLGPLTFVNKLRDVIPLDGFDDPPFLHLCDVMIGETADQTPILDSVSNKPPQHHFGDTKYHLVTYTPVATTRFREYFPEET